MHRFRQGSGLQAVSSGQQKGHLGVPFFVAVLGSAIELLQVFRLAEHHHLTLGPDVLEGAGAGAIEHTQQVAQAKGRGGEPDQGLGDANVAAVQVLDAQAPGPQLGNPSIGVNFLLPIWAMDNVAQGGACLAVWFKTKDAKIKAII